MSLVFVVIHFFHLYWLLQPFFSCCKSLCCLEFITLSFQVIDFVLCWSFFCLFILFICSYPSIRLLCCWSHTLWIRVVCGFVVCLCSPGFVGLFFPPLLKQFFRGTPFFFSVCFNEESKLEWKKGVLELTSFFSTGL